MGEFALFIARWVFRIMLVTAALSFMLIYPYYGELRTQANSIANQIAQSGYFDADYRKLFWDKLNGQKGFLGNSTLPPGSPDTGKLLPGIGSPSPIEIEACYYEKSLTDNSCIPMTPITADQRNSFVMTAESTGVAPNKSFVLDRDTPFKVRIKSNFKLQTILMGREIVAYVPMEVESVMVTRRDYRW